MRLKRRYGRDPYFLGTIQLVDPTTLGEPRLVGIDPEHTPVIFVVNDTTLEETRLPANLPEQFPNSTVIIVSNEPPAS